MNENDFKNKKISIIGLGLIGGSLAKIFIDKLGINDITAINRSSKSLDQAIKEGTITRGFHEINEYVWNSDIIFICTPVGLTKKYINFLSDKVSPQCIITDVGSTKSEIIDFVNSMENPPCFIGGHPMAGSEKTGYTASYSHLFENAFYILSHCKTTTTEAMETMTSLVKSIGAIPVEIDGIAHDNVTASISHVPHILASSLVNMVKKLDSSSGKMQLLAAGGFKDITRIASSSPEMWENIVLSNKEQVQLILTEYINEINSFKSMLDKEDSQSIYNFFETAKNYRNSFHNVKKSLISQSFEIVADVIDEPGIIGEIATILGDNSINIKNINVSNNREFELGCLKISLSNQESAHKAYDLLKQEGYTVYKNF